MTEDQPQPFTEEALHWLAVLQDDAASAEERHAFQAWLAKSPAHRDAWQRAQHVWSRLDALAPALRSRPAMAENAHPLGRRLRATRRQWLQLTAAASVAAVAGGCLLSGSALFADYKTDVAEHRSLRLADGSQIELGSDSAVSVALERNARIVTLYRGEAFFTVAADAGRPFIVRAAGGCTRALGTAFNVKTVGDTATVTVSEHAVLVTAPDNERVELPEGGQVRYGPDGLSGVVAADLAAVLGWQRNRLIFQDMPLGEVVADLERYSRGRIVITDAALKNLPVTAVFDADQAEAAIDTIAKTLPIRLRRLGHLLTVISPAG